MSRGCDYAWERPNLQGLRQAGIEFACRYLSYDATGKNLTRGEADALRANGIAPVSNWEYNPQAAKNGINQGIKDARTANQQHAACGGPPDRPIYFSVDFDASIGDLAAIRAYLIGCGTVIGRGRVGVYGGLRVMQDAQSTGHATWFWQTSAWSRGIWQSGVHIRQYAYNQRIGGQLVDLDQGMTGDVGQWGATAAPAPSAPGGHESWDFGSVINQISGRLMSMGNAMDGMATRIRAARR